MTTVPASLPARLVTAVQKRAGNVPRVPETEAASLTMVCWSRSPLSGAGPLENSRVLLSSR